MLRLHDIMTRDVVTLSPHLSLRSAMETLVVHHIGGAPVIAKGEVVGVCSAHDLMRLATTHVSTGEGAPALDIEAPEILVDSTGHVVPTAVYRTELWPIESDEHGGRTTDPAMLRGAALDTHTVAEAMTAGPVCALPPETRVPFAAEFMRAAAIHRVLVMVRRELRGIVTTSDIAHAMAQETVTCTTCNTDRTAPPIRSSCQDDTEAARSVGRVG